MGSQTPVRIGGQAVIEGVMMRAPGAVATAVRRRDGGVAVRAARYRSPAERVRLLKLPVFRGAVVLIESLVLGMKALMYSADVVSEEGADRPKEHKTVSLSLIHI